RSALPHLVKTAPPRLAFEPAQSLAAALSRLRPRRSLPPPRIEVEHVIVGTGRERWHPSFFEKHDGSRFLPGQIPHEVPASPARPPGWLAASFQLGLSHARSASSFQSILLSFMTTPRQLASAARAKRSVPSISDCSRHQRCQPAGSVPVEEAHDLQP